MSTITAQDVLDTVKRVAVENPSHVYKAPPEDISCMYTRGATGTGCIVGEALMRLGVEREVLERFDNNTNAGDASAYGVLDHLAAKGLIDYDVRRTSDRLAADDLLSIQVAQDEGQSWGAAIAAAEVR